MQFLSRPVHSPDMKFCGPGCAAERIDGETVTEPFRFSVPAQTGNIRQQFFAVIFHDVNFAVSGPAAIDSECPPDRP